MKLNKRKIQKNIVSILLTVLVALIAFLILNAKIPAEPSLISSETPAEKSNNKETVHFVALGDSLTQGVGDETKQGGYVPIVAADLKDRYELTSVQANNYGISGERSDQILARVEKKEKLRQSLASADFITITVGGNDVMRVFKRNLLHLKVSTFTKPQKAYQKRLQTMFTEIRKLNKNAPIYIVGIYNPFYLNFPELTDMQTVIDNWNKGTKATVAKQKGMYFIPINKLLYKGVDGKEAVETATTTASSTSGKSLNLISNDALYSEDSFHPNTIGYQLIAGTLRDQIVKTKNEWLFKETK
jgi:lysophospholipase L1-like esterase